MIQNPEEVRARQVHHLRLLGYEVYEGVVPMPEARSGALLVCHHLSVDQQVRPLGVVLRDHNQCYWHKNGKSQSFPWRWIYDVQDGSKMLGRSPKSAWELLRDRGRRGLKLIEGLSLFREKIFLGLETALRDFLLNQNFGLEEMNCQLQKNLPLALEKLMAVFSGADRGKNFQFLQVNGFQIEFKSIKILETFMDFVGCWCGKHRGRIPGLVMINYRPQIQCCAWNEWSYNSGPASCSLN